MTHRIFDFLMSFTKKHTNSGVCTACLPTDTALCGNKARAPQIGRNKIRMLRYKTAPGSIFFQKNRRICNYLRIKRLFGLHGNWVTR